MTELVDEHLQRHAVLERVRNRLRESIGESGNRRPFLCHRQEDFARLAILEEPYCDVALVTRDVEFVCNRRTLVGKLAARRTLHDLDHFLDDLADVRTGASPRTARVGNARLRGVERLSPFAAVTINGDGLGAQAP